MKIRTQQIKICGMPVLSHQQRGPISSASLSSSEGTQCVLLSQALWQGGRECYFEEGVVQYG